MVDNTSMSKGKKQILPIFYDVEPDDVKLKTPLYTTAMDEHKKKFPRHEVESWEGALMKVDQIKGWELPKCKSKAELMKLVVKEVVHRLKRRYKFVIDHLVGLDGPVEELLKLLDVNCSDVRLFGIHGMGGIGKSTLAKVIFNKLSSHFGMCCAFLDDIREKSKKDGFVKLQKKLLTEIVDSKAAENIDDVDYGRMRIGETLCSKKVLIVLDDVDEKEQIENLIGQDQLHQGTRIIITTRNKSVLMTKKGILAHEVKQMNFDHALELFNRHALLEGSLAKDFDSLSKDIVSTTGGLPLALETIGSFLCGKHKAIWKETLDKLKEIPDEKVQKTLRISYDALNDRQRTIFLDVACFFINEDMTNAIYMWTDCKLFPYMEIEVLVSMSLIKIMDDNKLWMHDQLRDLGREIVRQESPTNLGKRSRLWNSKDVLELVRTKKMASKLKFLALVECRGITRTPDLSGCLTLERLTFHNCWNLKEINSSIGKLKYLLDLNITHCRSLEDLPEEIGGLVKLKRFSLEGCYQVRGLPSSIGDLASLKELDISTTGITSLPDSIGNLRCLLVLNLPGSDIIELPDTIEGLVELQYFGLKGRKIRQLPNSIGELKSLCTLDLSCNWFSASDGHRWELPKAIGMLEKLEELYLGQCKELKGKIPPEIG